jgi:hypothetical protein
VQEVRIGTIIESSAVIEASEPTRAIPWTPSSTPAPQGLSSTSSSGGRSKPQTSSNTVAIAASLAAVGLVCISAASYFFWRRRSSKKGNPEGKAVWRYELGAQNISSSNSLNGSRSGRRPNNAPGKQYVAPLRRLAVQKRSATATIYSDATLALSSSAGGASLRAFSPRRTAPTQLPDENATLQQQMRFLHQQLDCYGPDDVCLQRYVLLGRSERRCGGMLNVPRYSIACACSFRISSILK